MRRRRLQLQPRLAEAALVANLCLHCPLPAFLLRSLSVSLPLFLSFSLSLSLFLYVVLVDEHTK